MVRRQSDKRGQTIYLAHFDDNKRYIVGEGTVPPGSHAVEDCLLHLLKGLCCRVSHHLRQAFNAEHFSTLIENLDETIGVQNQTIAGYEVNFVR